jgi:dynein heavy chain 2
MTENRKLRKMHGQIGDQVVSLVNIDLIRNKPHWKEKADSIGRIIESMTTSKDPPLLKKWKVHWDFQIFKALELQYKFGLQSLNEHLNEIKADIIVQSKCISFRPSIEELRGKL